MSQWLESIEVVELMVVEGSIHPDLEGAYYLRGPSLKKVGGVIFFYFENGWC